MRGWEPDRMPRWRAIRRVHVGIGAVGSDPGGRRVRPSRPAGPFPVSFVPSSVTLCGAGERVNQTRRQLLLTNRGVWDEVVWRRTRFRLRARPFLDQLNAHAGRATPPLSADAQMHGSAVRAHRFLESAGSGSPEAGGRRKEKRVAAVDRVLIRSGVCNDRTGAPRP
jgi:hypothetical protein